MSRPTIQTVVAKSKAKLTDRPSDIRQVPDSQEVYLDKNGFTSIIFDITERVDEATAATDEDAIKYHFSDIVSGTNDTTNVWSGGTATFAHIP